MEVNDTLQLTCSS